MEVTYMPWARKYFTYSVQQPQVEDLYTVAGGRLCANTAVDVRLKPKPMATVEHTAKIWRRKRI